MRYITKIKGNSSCAESEPFKNYNVTIELVPTEEAPASKAEINYIETLIQWSRCRH